MMMMVMVCFYSGYLCRSGVSAAGKTAKNCIIISGDRNSINMSSALHDDSNFRVVITTNQIEMPEEDNKVAYTH